MNGFMLDSARCLEGRRYYRRFIEFAADRGIDTLLWHFTDDQGCSMRFDALPAAASPYAYSKRELRAVVDFARERGITIIPELATLGHTRYITGVPEYADLAETQDFYSSICPVHPRAQDLIERLLDEVVEVFDAPLVHLGLDEINCGHHPLTRAALASHSTGELFAQHAVRLHKQLARHGRRAMMWADQLLGDPTIVPLLPRDILMCNWQYDPDVCHSTTQRLLDWGFEVVVCPALISHNQTLFPSEKFSLPNLRTFTAHLSLDPRVVGTITTIWTPTRFLAEWLWPAVDYAAAIMREGHHVDLRLSLATYARRCHGWVPDAAWLDAMMALMEHAPRRAEWGAVAQLTEPRFLDRLDLAAEAARFADIRAALRSARTAIRLEQESYDSLLLLADVLAHAWERAHLWRTDQLTPATLQQSQRLTGRLSAAWDAGRFGDDPRKGDPRLLFDRNDHLLLAFEAGTRVLQGVLQADDVRVSVVAGR